MFLLLNIFRRRRLVILEGRARVSCVKCQQRWVRRPFVGKYSFFFFRCSLRQSEAYSDATDRRVQDVLCWHKLTMLSQHSLFATQEARARALFP